MPELSIIVPVYKVEKYLSRCLDSILKQEDREKMAEWLTAMEVDISDLDIADTDALMTVWKENYDEKAKPAGMTKAQRNYYKRLNASLGSLGSSGKMTVTEKDSGVFSFRPLAGIMSL